MNAETKHPQQQLLPATLEECEALLPTVEEELAALRAKLESVRAKRHTTGEFADPDWYRRATSRLRFSGVFHQQLTRKIAELKRAERRAHNVRVECSFIEIARERLDSQTFAAMMRDAQERAGRA
jgi:hypothetical protein